MLAFFDKLLHRKEKEKEPQTPSSVDIKTAPLSEEQLKSVTQQGFDIQPPQYISACAQSVGMQRDHNEDTLFMLNTILANGQDDIPMGIYIVADGMGGHQYGEVASAVATRAMAEHMITRVYRLFLGTQGQSQGESLQEIMEGGVAEAQQAVAARAPGGGTTLTAALAIGGQVTLAHVGDSRAYFITPGGEIRPVTHDHSLVQRLMELGQISEEEARVHPQRNVLYRAVGQAEPLHPDIHTYEFPHPGYMLICSDGLWGVVPENEIFRIVRAHTNLNASCQALIDAANQLGGPDNITAILVHYPN